MSDWQRNRNPYQGIDWPRQLRFTGCTHLHCTTREDFDTALRSGLEFATFSNYYPSTPYYPAASVHENTFKLHQDGYVQDGRFVRGRIDFPRLFAQWGEDCSIFPADEGARLFPDPPPGFLEAPNAEHHLFSDYNVYLHITAPGSFFSSGNFYRQKKGTPLDRHGIHMGTAMPWRTAFQAMLDNLLVPEGGGIVINHPQWSHLPHAFLCEMLDFDQRVLGLEVINADCGPDYTAAAESQWDEVLGTGRQCYGFCVQDHLSGPELLGRSILLPEERTVEACLKAYRQGRFYGAMKGHGLTFESIHFDGRTLRVRCDKEAIMLLITHQGVQVELWTGRELVYTVKDEERDRHVFLRVTAMDKDSGEKLFTQPVMLVP